VRVVVLFNQPVLPREHPEADSEQWVATAVEDISGLLTATGYRVSQLAVGRNLFALKSQLAACRPDVVFNLFEGLADRPATEVAVARLLERLEVPFTGSPSQALRLALNKHLAKRRLRAAGIPTPWSCVVSKVPLRSADFPWPVIVKPARRDASEGIDQGSVVTTPTALARRVAKLLEQYGPPVLIEQFLPGREFTVALLETPELVPLPITEVQFTVSSAVPWPILSYAAKWLPGSPDYEATDMLKAVPLPPALSRSLIALAKSAYRAVECRDYARIDLRMTLAGEPMILEVNANPDMSPTACFAKALLAAGLDRAELLAHFVRQAAARAKHQNTIIKHQTNSKHKGIMT
jgi:D-alanine-D-alanine ligase